MGCVGGERTSRGRSAASAARSQGARAAETQTRDACRTRRLPRPRASGARPPTSPPRPAGCGRARPRGPERRARRSDSARRRQRVGRRPAGGCEDGQPPVAVEATIGTASFGRRPRRWSRARWRGPRGGEASRAPRVSRPAARPGRAAARPRGTARAGSPRRPAGARALLSQHAGADAPERTCVAFLVSGQGVLSHETQPCSPPPIRPVNPVLRATGGTRRVLLVRKEGRDVSSSYGREGGRTCGRGRRYSSRSAMRCGRRNAAHACHGAGVFFRRGAVIVC